MSTQFLAGASILKAIHDANGCHTVRRLGVAYWGPGAVDRLALGKKLSGTQVICDLWSEGCDVDAILSLIMRGGQVVTVDGFHAKTYLYPDRVVLGSANASKGGLGSNSLPPSRTETALLCDDLSVLEDASRWFDATWKRGNVVTVPMIEAARDELVAVRNVRRRSLLDAILDNPKLFDGLDFWVTVYNDGTISKKAERTWNEVRGEYGSDDIAAYEARGEWPIYEVDGDKIEHLHPGRIYLDFSRSKQGKLTWNGIWQVRSGAPKAIGETGRFLVLLNHLPSVRGCQLGHHEAAALSVVLAAAGLEVENVDSVSVKEAAAVARDMLSAR